MRRALQYALVVSTLLMPVYASAAAKRATNDEASVQSFVRSFVQAANKGDARAMSKMYSKSAGVSTVNGGEIARGFDAIRKDNEFLSARGGAYRFDLRRIDVRPLGADHALAVAPLKLTVSGLEESVELPSVMTLVLEKSGSSWLIVHEHLSSQPEEEDDDQGPDEKPLD